MISDIIIIDEPHIWNARLKKGNSTIELSKLTNQQFFLIGDNPEAVVEYYQQISEREVRRIDLATITSSYTRFDDMDLLLINLN